MPHRRVLLVSADPDFLALYSVALRVLGYDVPTAGGAQAALDAVRRETPDLVVTDYPIVESSGRSLTSLLREDGRTAELPVLCVTSWVLEHEVAAAYGAGATEVLRMPTAPRDLAAAVERLVPERHAPDAARARTGSGTS